MESAKTVLKNFAVKVAQKARLAGIRCLRKAIDCADDWCHAQEVKLRDQAARLAYLAEVDPVASAAREKALKRETKSYGVSAHGCTSDLLTNQVKTTGVRRRLSGASVTPRRRMPRLKYEHGEFVRQEVSSH